VAKVDRRHRSLGKSRPRASEQHLRRHAEQEIRLEVAESLVRAGEAGKADRERGAPAANSAAAAPWKVRFSTSLASR